MQQVAYCKAVPIETGDCGKPFFCGQTLSAFPFAVHLLADTKMGCYFLLSVFEKVPEMTKIAGEEFGEIRAHDEGFGLGDMIRPVTKVTAKL
jgi:hypothetical protein